MRNSAKTSATVSCRIAGTYAVLCIFLLSALMFPTLGACSCHTATASDSSVRLQHQAQIEPRIRTLSTESQWDNQTLGIAETHYYDVPLNANYYVRVAVYTKAIDVVLTLFAPDGARLEQVEMPRTTYGKKSVMWVSDKPGNYRIEVTSSDKVFRPGSYRIVIYRLAAITEQNRRLITADRLTAEGWRLHEMGTEEALRQAIPKLIDAISIWRALREQWYEATALMYLGEVYAYLGEYEKAIAVYEPALIAWQSLGDVANDGWTYNNIGLVYSAIGEKQKALDNFTLSLRAFERENEFRSWNFPRGLAIVLTSLGSFYASLGDHERALDYLNRALPYWRADNDFKGEARVLSRIGDIQFAERDWETALNSYRDVLRVSRETSDRLSETRALVSIGKVHAASSQHQAAIHDLKDALIVARLAGDRFGQADALNTLGLVYQSRGELQEALDLYSEALSLYRVVSNQDGEADALYNIARAERDRANLNEARERIEQSLSVVERVRIDMASEELRASYVATVRHYYEFYIDLLMSLHRRDASAGFDARAIQASERARARSLLDVLAGARANVRHGVDPQLLERERHLQQRLDARRQRKKELLDTEPSGEQIKFVEREIAALEVDQRELAAEIRIRSPRYAALTQPEPLSAAQIQRLLDDDTLLLEYSLGDERSYLWAVSPTSFTSHELPPRRDLEPAARRLYDLVTARSRRLKRETDVQYRSRVARAEADYSLAAADLSSILLGPVAEKLRKKRLVIVAEGALQFIPFGALPAPVGSAPSVKDSSAHRPIAASPRTLIALGRPLTPNPEPLILTHETISLPSASTLALLRRDAAHRKPPTKSVAVLADPVFTTDDPRVGRMIATTQRPGNERPNPTFTKPELERALSDVGEAGEGKRLPRLLATRWEAQQVISFSPKDSLRALDFVASRETVTSAELGQYRVIHFATHALIDSVHPELSGIVLSLVDKQGRPQDGFLRAHEIFNLNLSADLVVLSACRTGLGKDVRGEGLISLTRAFMYAGAPRVLVSLWRVNDQATAELMARFYKRMLNGLSQSRPSALRQAQLEMLKDKRWQSPYFWAGFVLQGEWK